MLIFLFIWCLLVSACETWVASSAMYFEVLQILMKCNPCLLRGKKVIQSLWQYISNNNVNLITQAWYWLCKTMSNGLFYLWTLHKDQKGSSAYFPCPKKKCQMRHDKANPMLLTTKVLSNKSETYVQWNEYQLFLSLFHSIRTYITHWFLAWCSSCVSSSLATIWPGLILLNRIN